MASMFQKMAAQAKEEMTSVMVEVAEEEDAVEVQVSAAPPAAAPDVAAPIASATLLTDAQIADEKRTIQGLIAARSEELDLRVEDLRRRAAESDDSPATREMKRRHDALKMNIGELKVVATHINELETLRANLQSESGLSGGPTEKTQELIDMIDAKVKEEIAAAYDGPEAIGFQVDAVFRKNQRQPVDAEAGSAPKKAGLTRDTVFPAGGPSDVTRAFFATSPHFLKVIEANPAIYAAVAKSPVSDAVFGQNTDADAYMTSNPLIKAILTSGDEPYVVGKPRDAKQAVLQSLFKDGWFSNRVSEDMVEIARDKEATDRYLANAAAQHAKTKQTAPNDDIARVFSKLPVPASADMRSDAQTYIDSLAPDPKMGVDCFIANADAANDVPSIDPRTGKNIANPAPGETLANGFTIPPRPNLWPCFMVWPNQRDMNRLKEQAASREQYEIYFASMTELQHTMIERARQVAEHISEHEKKSGLFNVSRTMDHFAMARSRSKSVEYHSGVRWALLVDPRSPDHALMSSMRTVSERRIVCMDEGYVIANDDIVRIGRTSEMAVAIAINEGVARGWTNLKMEGHPEFAKIAIQKAREANIRAEITIKSGPFGLIRRNFVVMPGVPVFEVGQDGKPVDTGKMSTTRKDAPTQAPIGNKVPEDGFEIEDENRPVKMSEPSPAQ